MKNRLSPCPHCKPATQPVVQQTRMMGWSCYCPTCHAGPDEGTFRRRDAESKWDRYCLEHQTKESKDAPGHT